MAYLYCRIQDLAARGLRLQEILKQAQYEPVSLAIQVLIIYAGTKGFIRRIPVDRVKEWEVAAIRFLETSYPDIIKAIETERQISDETDERIKQALTAFNNSWS